MLLFTIGIMITIMIYFSLVSINDVIEEMAREDQMHEVGKLISSEINRAYIGPGRTTIVFNIPKKISEEGYRVYVEDDGSDYNLTIKLGNKFLRIPINSEYNATGMFFSSSGKVKIEKIKNKILIGRF